MNDILSDKDAQAVLDILTEQTGAQRGQLTPQARLQADLGADSLTVVEISMALEDRFNISIPDGQWDNDITVEQLLEALAKLLKARNAEATETSG